MEVVKDSPVLAVPTQVLKVYRRGDRTPTTNRRGDRTTTRYRRGDRTTTTYRR